MREQRQTCTKQCFVVFIRIILLLRYLESGHRVSVLSNATAGRHACAALVLVFTLQVVRPHREVRGLLQHKVIKPASQDVIGINNILNLSQ